MAGMGQMTAAQIGTIVRDAAYADASEPKRIVGMSIRRETDRAVLVGQKGATFETWLPKSQMADINRWTRIGTRTGREFPMIDFTIPGWLATEKML